MFGKSIITWFVASGLLVTMITLGWPYVMDRPYLYIKVIRHEEEPVSKSIIAIYNIGRGSATNLRVTINPEYNMTRYEPEFYTEDVKLVDTGQRSLIATIPRLAPGAQVQIAVFLNSTDSTPSFKVWANYDTGTTTGMYETELITTDLLQQRMTILFVVAYGMLIAIIVLTITPFIYRWRRFGSPWPTKKISHLKSTKLKILVDEMLDGVDEKLRSHGYEAYSVKKLREKGEKLQSGYSILKYSEVNHMILVTENDENIDGCTENGIKVVKHGQKGTFEDLMSELKKLVSS